jgi:hypothetical protein
VVVKGESWTGFAIVGRGEVAVILSRSYHHRLLGK